MTALTISVPRARRALTAVHALTEGSSREWCTTDQVAEALGVGSRDAVALLGWLHDLDLVILLGSSRRYERRWRLTEDGLDALGLPFVPAGWEGSE